ncbi:YiaA/YiaB family inner membrane protein [Aurantimonas sp. VKM B-3413]|uniref:YiaA/YiaB family inner membrane protein n=1 Tax=Aurantimonas sp. VKM B-3413 TaxID=2779401 RepID=UPI001E352202|nr:YiaA/YiaB family inner membrane protein [Aurantimonas sp. VKM B-3413]MCB8835906.1 hypothetical protein [Aurantimonas sp. VKM B-3413]
MNANRIPTNAWTIFTVISFVVASLMMAGGIYFLEASFAAKGFYAMAAIMLVHTTVTITRTLRDVEEANKETIRQEELRTEKMIGGLSRAA